SGYSADALSGWTDAIAAVRNAILPIEDQIDVIVSSFLPISTHSCSYLCHAHPIKLSRSDIDLVVADEIEASVIADPKHRHAGGKRVRAGIVTYAHRHDIGGDQYLPGPVDMEGSAVDAFGVDVLNRFRFAGD